MNCVFFDAFKILKKKFLINSYFLRFLNLQKISNGEKNTKIGIYRIDNQGVEFCEKCTGTNYWQTP